MNDKERSMQPLIDRHTGIIRNLSDILDKIKNETDDKFLNNYLNELNSYREKNPNRIDEISGLALKSALESRIDKINKDRTKNKNVLKYIQSTNMNLKNLSIVESKRRNADGFRVVEYIKYIDENKEVKFIECTSDTMLYDYVKSHPDFSKTGTSKELFEYFRTKTFGNIPTDEATSQGLEKTNEIHIMNVVEFTSLLNNLYQGKKISNEDTKRMHLFASSNIEEMRKGTIDYDHQNALDCYMEFLREKLGSRV